MLTQAYAHTNTYLHAYTNTYMCTQIHIHTGTEEEAGEGGEGAEKF